MSRIMVFRPFTKSAVDFVNSAVSSLPCVSGTGDSRSPSTRSFMRLAQACMGRLILLDSFSATTTDAIMEIIITAMLINIPKYVSAK